MSCLLRYTYVRTSIFWVDDILFVSIHRFSELEKEVSSVFEPHSIGSNRNQQSIARDARKLLEMMKSFLYSDMYNIPRVMVHVTISCWDHDDDVMLFLFVLAGEVLSAGDVHTFKPALSYTCHSSCPGNDYTPSVNET